MLGGCGDHGLWIFLAIALARVRDQRMPDPTMTMYSRYRCQIKVTGQVDVAGEEDDTLVIELNHTSRTVRKDNRDTRQTENPARVAQHDALDHSVWHSPPPDGRSNFLSPSPRPRAPLTRTRSAEPLPPMPLPPQQNPSGIQYYDDYVNIYEPAYVSSQVQPPQLVRAISRATTPTREATPTVNQWRFPEPFIPQQQQLILDPEPQVMSPLPVVITSMPSDEDVLVPSRSGGNRQVGALNRPPLGLRTSSGSSRLTAEESPLTLRRLPGAAPSAGPPTPGRARTPGLTEQEREQEFLQDGIKRFQEGSLPESDCEWHRLVSVEFRDTLPKNEVQRQSVIFEVIKSEKDYVRDVRIAALVIRFWSSLNMLFMPARDRIRDPLMSADPPIIGPELQLRTFRNEVFQNITDILSRHRICLKALYMRQADQHPLVSSIADIELDAALSLQQDYEVYIKQYPISESRHRRELKSNKAYASFIQQALSNPLLRKRDLISLISRPHPDQDAMPLTLNILQDFVKSTQPGIAVADAKVKLWSLCESLAGKVARRSRGEYELGGGSGWSDVHIALLDNYFVITSEEARNGVVAHILVSRPLPLDCMGLGKFADPPESRKEEGGGSSLRIFSSSPSKAVYPFTVFHKCDVQRRYTFYTHSETSRIQWYETIFNALGVRKAHQDGNKWFAPTTIDDNTFRSPTIKVPSNSKATFTGRITSAATFVHSGRSHLIVATGQGIYASEQRSNPPFKKILPLSGVTSMTTLSKFGILVLLHGSTLQSYNLHILTGLIGGTFSQESFANSMERLTDRDVNVTFFGAGEMSGRTLVVYAAKGFRHYTMQALEAVPGPREGEATRRPNDGDTVSTFRPYGSQFYVPKDAYSVAMLRKTLAIATSEGSSLLSQHTFGCYITKHGSPTRKNGFVRWETPIHSFVARGPHVLLVGHTDIEVRHIPTGRLIQLIEGKEVRLLQKLAKGDGPTLVARRGGKDDDFGLSDELIEIVETSALSDQTWNESDLMWEEWET
ncbi:uncharacterized protein EI90DRAFT_3117436 [Cantharellus anzutake]|uniref:uncharacterized protein n=1 Tax=Cantharellus anzutake TaxID=1750568 RepID=UPI001907F667|nr:uncharacterized protein EI90DRAFT_3117436 [Cantharellus anzutake]KAF8339639.1 hypothetical protein EI90DRAFT_3117436 [Cantharellus anzutake]